MRIVVNIPDRVALQVQSQGVQLEDYVVNLLCSQPLPRTEQVAADRGAEMDRSILQMTRRSNGFAEQYA